VFNAYLWQELQTSWKCQRISRSRWYLSSLLPRRCACVCVFVCGVVYCWREWKYARHLIYSACCSSL
jgi:hypothetical protein